MASTTGLAVNFMQSRFRVIRGGKPFVGAVSSKKLMG